MDQHRTLKISSGYWIRVHLNVNVFHASRLKSQYCDIIGDMLLLRQGP
jgi:hypothetical protein